MRWAPGRTLPVVVAFVATFFLVVSLAPLVLRGGRLAWGKHLRRDTTASIPPVAQPLPLQPLQSRAHVLALGTKGEPPILFHRLKGNRVLFIDPTSHNLVQRTLHPPTFDNDRTIVLAKDVVNFQTLSTGTRLLVYRRVPEDTHPHPIAPPTLQLTLVHLSTEEQGTIVNRSEVITTRAAEQVSVVCEESDAFVFKSRPLDETPPGTVDVHVWTPERGAMSLWRGTSQRSRFLFSDHCSVLWSLNTTVLPDDSVPPSATLAPPQPISTMRHVVPGQLLRVELSRDQNGASIVIDENVVSFSLSRDEERLLVGKFDSKSYMSKLQRAEKTPLPNVPPFSRVLPSGNIFADVSDGVDDMMALYSPEGVPLSLPTHRGFLLSPSGRFAVLQTPNRDVFLVTLGDPLIPSSNDTTVPLLMLVRSAAGTVCKSTHDVRFSSDDRWLLFYNGFAATTAYAPLLVFALDDLKDLATLKNKSNTDTSPLPTPYAIVKRVYRVWGVSDVGDAVFHWINVTEAVPKDEGMDGEDFTAVDTGVLELVPLPGPSELLPLSGPTDLPADVPANVVADAPENVTLLQLCSRAQGAEIDDDPFLDEDGANAQDELPPGSDGSPTLGAIQGPGGLQGMALASGVPCHAETVSVAWGIAVFDGLRDGSPSLEVVSTLPS